MKTIIRGASCVLPGKIEVMDVLLADGKIHLSPPQTASCDQVIDAKGLHLLPGVIDDQVHFRDPGLTHKEDLRTGSMACAKGGVTSFLEMPNTTPNTVTEEALINKLAIGDEKSLVNYGFYIGATPQNVDVLQKVQRTPGIKIFIGSSTGDLLVDEQDALERIFAETKLPICAHCEDETTVRENKAKFFGGRTIEDHSRIRDHRAAMIATSRAVDLARRYKHRFHVLHVSARQELQIIEMARGIVTAEVCVHHLLFNVDDYPRLGTRIQMNPSIKDKQDNDALWDALNDGRIQVIATDHAPHTLEEKAQPYPKSPSGLPAVENSLALMLDAVNRDQISLGRVVSAMCDAPAKIWDIPNKGRLQEGFDADVVLVDLARKHTILDENQVTKSRWSPWHGVELQGLPLKTWVGGNLVYDEGTFGKVQGNREIAYDHSLPGYWTTGNRD
jgi:dihydroorotase